MYTDRNPERGDKKGQEGRGGGFKSPAGSAGA